MELRLTTMITIFKIFSCVVPPPFIQIYPAYGAVLFISVVLKHQSMIHIDTIRTFYFTMESVSNPKSSQFPVNIPMDTSSGNSRSQYVYSRTKALAIIELVSKMVFNVRGFDSVGRSQLGYVSGLGRRTGMSALFRSHLLVRLMFDKTVAHPVGESTWEIFARSGLERAHKVNCDKIKQGSRDSIRISSPKR